MTPQLVALALLAGAPSPEIFWDPGAAKDLETVAQGLDRPIQDRGGFTLNGRAESVLAIAPHRFVFFRTLPPKPGEQNRYCIEAVRLETLEGDRLAVGAPLKDFVICEWSQLSYYPQAGRILVDGAEQAVFDAATGKKVASYPRPAGGGRSFLLPGDRVFRLNTMGDTVSILPASDPLNATLGASAKWSNFTPRAPTYPYVELETTAGLKVLNMRDGTLTSSPPWPGQRGRNYGAESATPTGLAAIRVEDDGTNVYLLDVREGATPRRIANVPKEEGYPELDFDAAHQQLAIRWEPPNPWLKALALSTSDQEAPAPKGGARNAQDRHLQEQLPLLLREITVSWPAETATEACFEVDTSRWDDEELRTEKWKLAARGEFPACSGIEERALAVKRAWKQIPRERAKSPAGVAAYTFNALVRQRADELLEVLDPYPLVRQLQTSELLLRMARPAMEVAAEESPKAKSAIWESALRDILVPEVGTETFGVRYRLLRALADGKAPPKAVLEERSADAFTAVWSLEGKNPVTVRIRFRRAAAPSPLPWIAVRMSSDAEGISGAASR